MSSVHNVDSLFNHSIFAYAVLLVNETVAIRLYLKHISIFLYQLTYLVVKLFLHHNQAVHCQLLKSLILQRSVAHLLRELTCKVLESGTQLPSTRKKPCVSAWSHTRKSTTLTASQPISVRRLTLSDTTAQHTSASGALPAPRRPPSIAITAFNTKKRKLAPPATDTIPSPYNAPNTNIENEPESPQSSSSRAIPSSPAPRASESPGPPGRLLRTRLQISTIQADSPYEAASPSAAFAEVTLNSDAISEVDGVSGCASNSQVIEQDTTSPLKNQNGVTSVESLMREGNSRSVSPAKRRASEMDGDHVRGEEDVTITIESATGSSPNEGARESVPRLGSIPTSNGLSNVNVTESGSSTEKVMDGPPPSLDEQVQLVMSQVELKEDKEGLSGYIISRQWLGRVVARSAFSGQMGPFDKDSLDGEIGPVNNESIIASGGFYKN